jgi:DNA excision repair protein ERCC-4
MTRHPIPAQIDPSHIVAVQDSREQLPLDLTPLAVEVGTLTTGDYSLRGLEHCVCIERKGLSDILACMGGERERFSREVQRMLGYPVRALVIESTWETFERGEYRSKITPQSAVGSLLGWICQGIPVVMAGDHARAGRFVARMLMIVARRRWRENRALLARLDPPEPKQEE